MITQNLFALLLNNYRFMASHGNFFTVNNFCFSNIIYNFENSFNFTDLFGK